MGGWGSGQRWSSKDTTADYRQIDVRRLQRDGLLERRWSFSWQWSRNGEPTGNINIRPESDRIILNYRSRERGGEWTDQEYPVTNGGHWQLVQEVVEVESGKRNA